MGQDAGGEAADPSMEDILASIRRILNDDEANAAASATGAPPAPSPAEDVFLLDQSMLIEEPPAMAAVPPTMAPTDSVTPRHVKVEPVDHEHAEPEPSAFDPAAPTHPASELPPPPPAGAEPASDQPMTAPAAAAAASASLGALVRVMGQKHTPVYGGGPTLEDMVRDEIRPMMKAWLDENLAPLVERLVRAEIARVTNGK